MVSSTLGSAACASRRMVRQMLCCHSGRESMYASTRGSAFVSVMVTPRSMVLAFRLGFGPTGTRRRRLGYDDLTGLWGDGAGGRIERGCQHEQGSPVLASQRAGEATSVQLDRLEHLAAFADAHAPPGPNIRIPNSAVRIEADPVRMVVPHRCPHAPVRKAAVGGNVERREPAGVGLGSDEPPVIGRHHHTVGKGEPISYLPHRAIRRDEGNDTGRKRPGGEVKADAVEVDVPVTIDVDLVPGVARETAEVGMDRKRAIRLLM